MAIAALVALALSYFNNNLWFRLQRLVIAPLFSLAVLTISGYGIYEVTTEVYDVPAGTVTQTTLVGTAIASLTILTIVALYTLYRSLMVKDMNKN